MDEDDFVTSLLKGFHGFVGVAIRFVTGSNNSNALSLGRAGCGHSCESVEESETFYSMIEREVKVDLILTRCLSFF